MSGYLELKYPSKSNLGIKPFKSWKRQWCILRPSPTNLAGGSIAVYCSEAGTNVGVVELSPGCVVRRTKSRTRPYAFAVFLANEPRKPRVLLAAQTPQDAQSWMEKIKAVLNGDKYFGNEISLKDLYSVMVVPTELSRKCGLNMDSIVTLSTSGVLLSRARKVGAFVEWKYIKDVTLTSDIDKNKICVIAVHSWYPNGEGELKLSSPQAGNLTSALRQAIKKLHASKPSKKLSKSEGDLLQLKCADDKGEPRRSSSYFRPSEVSLDDTDLVISKEWERRPSGQLARCSATDSLVQYTCRIMSATSLDDSSSDRRSIASVASGVYEEIPDLPAAADAGPELQGLQALQAEPEPAYESVAECVYATMRRTGRRCPPPPLPPRLPGLFNSTLKAGECWRAGVGACGGARGEGVTRHSSLGSLPRCCGAAAGAEPYSKTRTLPKPDRPKQAFSVFRKRLKSDSRLDASPKSDTKDSGGGGGQKKKKFDFATSRDLFKSFRAAKKMKGSKAAGALGKVGETKSCEFLDEAEPVATNRCSKSVECLEKDAVDGFLESDFDLSMEFNDDAVSALALPQEIVDLILRARERPELEYEYIPMSPVVPGAPPAMEGHYIAMAPRANLA